MLFDIAADLTGISARVLVGLATFSVLLTFCWRHSTQALRLGCVVILIWAQT